MSRLRLAAWVCIWRLEKERSAIWFEKKDFQSKRQLAISELLVLVKLPPD
jgi:hypothetical protein